MRTRAAGREPLILTIGGCLHPGRKHALRRTPANSYACLARNMVLATAYRPTSLLRLPGSR